MRVQLADDEKVRVIAKEKYLRCEAKGSLSDTMCLVSSSKSDKTYQDAAKSKRVHAAHATTWELLRSSPSWIVLTGKPGAPRCKPKMELAAGLGFPEHQSCLYGTVLIFQVKTRELHKKVHITAWKLPQRVHRCYAAAVTPSTGCSEVVAYRLNVRLSNPQANMLHPS